MSGRPSRSSALVLCAAVAAAVVLFYVSLYPAMGFRVSLGSDIPVYTWWSRYAGALGLGAFGTAGRPGTVGLVATLSRAMGLPAAAVAGALPPTLAAIIGLGAAAFVQAADGGDRLRFALSGLLTGTFLSLLVAGYLSTLVFGACFVASLACLAHGLTGPDPMGTRGDPRSGRAVAAAALLLGAAGLAHAQFLLLAVAVLAGGALALLPAWPRDRGSGAPLLGTGLGRLAIVAAVGGAVAAGGIGLAAVGASSPATIDTSRDSFLRRIGRSGDVLSSYRIKLAHDFPWYRWTAVLGVAATGITAVPRRFDSDRVALLWGALAAWAALALGGILALMVGLPVPGQRLAAFCLALPILGAIGLRRLLARSPGSRIRGTAVAAATAAFALVAWLGWGGQEPLVPPEALSQARAAAAALATSPPGTPLVALMDARRTKPALYVVRAANYIRAAVPPDRIVHVYVVVSTPADFLAGRPTRTGGPEHDRLAEDSWRRVGPLLGRGAVAVVLQGFDPTGYAAAASLPEVRSDPSRYRPAPGVVFLPGFDLQAGGTGAADGSPPTGVDLGAAPQSPWMPVWLSPALLVLLAVLGWPWAAWSLPTADAAVRLGLAPAFGTAAVGLAAVLVDGAGLRLGSAGGIVVVGAILFAGIGLIAMTR